MSFIKTHLRLLTVAVCCVAAGAGASAIATAGASTAGSHDSGPSAARAATRTHGPLGRFAVRAVQGAMVVHTKTGFADVTFERGTVDSVTGRQLTLTEGRPKAAYRRVTLTIPSNAVVRDNRHKATLAAVKPGQRVLVVRAPKRTLVAAHTPRSA